MKGKIINFAKTANVLLMFFSFLIVIVFVVVILIKELINDAQRSHHNSIEIVDAGEALDQKIEYTQSFVDKYGDIFVFKLRSNRIIKNDSEKNRPFGMYQNFSGGSYNDKETVNIIFAKIGEPAKALMQQNALILDFKAAILEPEAKGFKDRFMHQQHIMRIVYSDTNGDKLLNDKDSITLVTSSVDGSLVKDVAKDIVGFRFVDHNQILINYANSEVINIYDLKSEQLFPLDTNIK